VKTGLERSIHKKLRNLDIDAVKFHVPCREIRIRREGRWVLDLQPMFPGYILAHGNITDSSYSMVRQIADVYKWISDDSGPLQIQQDEIGLIKKLTDEDDVIHLSKVVYEGQKIVVVDGPLLGQEAIIRKVDKRKGRVKIAITMFSDEKLLDISVEDIENQQE
jgi:transcriptional antiterminator NusG